MRRIPLLVPVLAVLVLAGCTAEPAPTEPTTAVPEAVEITSIADVYTQLDCEGTTAAVGGAVLEQGECTPEGSEVAAQFWEFESPEAAREWFDNGELEVGFGQTAYAAGPVILLAPDAASAALMVEFAEQIS